MSIKLSKAAYMAAPVCANCIDYADEPKIVERARGWVHICNNSMRCPGQGDDDTDDRAEPLREHGRLVTEIKPTRTATIEARL